MDFRSPAVLRKPRPGIADVQCTRLKFEPGDSLLVRVAGKLDPGQRRKLRKSIQKWAGVELRIMIINVLEMDIEIDKRRTITDM